MIATLALLVPVTSLPSLQTPARDDYVSRFQQALAEYDTGHFGPAATLFQSAGELAPDAAVWRVHVAAALLQGGDPTGALQPAREALRRGYPPTDLAAIDARLMPDTSVPADLAPASTGTDTDTVSRIGNVGVLDYGDVVIARDLALLRGTAWDLVTGTVLATQRTTDTRVVGKVTYPDGRQEDIDFPVDPGRWDHVDGRLLDAPSSGRDGQPLAVPDAVRELTGTQMRRGLRTGFWSPGSGAHADVRFLEGAELTLSYARRRSDSPTPAAFNTVDADTLKLRTVPDDPWLDTTRVHDEERRRAVGEILGMPLRTIDHVYSLAGLPYLLVSRWIDLGYEGTPLIVVDVDGAAIVARPPIEPHGFWGVHLESFVLAEDANLLFASNSQGSTLEAISTEMWRVVWREESMDWSNPRARRITLRGDRVYSWADGPSHADVHDLRSGTVLLSGRESQFRGLDGSNDGRWAVGTSMDSYSLLDGRDFSHVLTMWLEDSVGPAPRLTAVGVDGTFSAPVERIRDSHVWLAGAFVRAGDVAPWLWDPLHVRSLRVDDDRSPRAVPAAR